MFGLFGPSRDEAVTGTKQALRKGRIIVRWEDEQYANFMILIPIRPATLKGYFKFPEAVKSLVDFIEYMIWNEKFDDGSDEMGEILKEDLDWSPNLAATRILVADGTPVFSWTPYEDEHGDNKCELFEI